MARPSHGTPLDDSLRRLQRAAQARVRGERVVDPEARAATCEVCGGADVRWGALCPACRDRLGGAREGHAG